jgi:Uma2 family endonuclease
MNVDAMLLRRGDYQTRIPEAGDVLLLIEIADRTLASDRTTKLALYARHGIAEYWIVDVAGECVEVYSGPVSDAYREMRIASGSEGVAPRALTSVRFTVRDIFS